MIETHTDHAQQVKQVIVVDNSSWTYLVVSAIEWLYRGMNGNESTLLDQLP